MRRKISIALSIIIIAANLGACASNAAAPADSKTTKASEESTSTSGSAPIKIAFSGPMTGDYAEYGQNFYAACEIAVDEINSNGGLLDGSPLELLQFDDKNSQDVI